MIIVITATLTLALAFESHSLWLSQKPRSAEPESCDAAQPHR